MRSFQGLRGVAYTLALAGALAVAGCAGQPNDDPHRIVAGVLTQLNAGGEAICVDSRTRGEPLAIFRTMSVAPNPARRPLFWRKPEPLDAARDLSAGTLVDNELRGGRSRLPLADSSDGALPMVDQNRLNGLARQAMLTMDTPQIAFDPTPTAPLAKVRWWPRNRLDRECREIYTISKPAILRDAAFVSVTAGHWGTIYVLERRGSDWLTTAQWTNWLY